MTIFIYTEVEIDNLYYGVNRPQSWWNEHPNAVKMIDVICESIKKDGLRNPLCVTNEKDDGTYRVNNGNQRLYALKKLNFKTIPCIIANGLNCKNIPSGIKLENKKQIFSYFSIGIKYYNLNPSCFQIISKDNDRYDPDKISN